MSFIWSCTMCRLFVCAGRTESAQQTCASFDCFQKMLPGFVMWLIIRIEIPSFSCLLIFSYQLHLDKCELLPENMNNDLHVTPSQELHCVFKGEALCKLLKMHRHTPSPSRHVQLLNFFMLNSYEHDVYPTIAGILTLISRVNTIYES